MKTINEILKKYTTGEADLEETNAALAGAGAGYHLEPGRNEITEENRQETFVGYYPRQANGWGLLDTGTGTLDKVSVTCGQLDAPVNAVREDGSTNMPAYLNICGRVYEVLGDRLAEVRERPRQTAPVLPEKADLRRRRDLAGQMADQRTRSGTYRVTYDLQGYAIRSVKQGGGNGNG